GGIPMTREQESVDRVESPTENVAKTVEKHVTAEVDAGKSELVQMQKTTTEFLKAGGHSGITGEFGKIVIDEVPAFKPGVEVKPEQKTDESGVKLNDAGQL